MASKNSHCQRNFVLNTLSETKFLHLQPYETMNISSTLSHGVPFVCYFKLIYNKVVCIALTILCGYAYIKFLETHTNESS